jgi:hypothetical protein
LSSPAIDTIDRFMALLGTIYCRRCDDLVEPIRPWRGWRPAWLLWRVGLACILLFFPFLAWDYVCLLPSTMCYLLAGGPLRSFARTRPVCRVCSLDLDEGTRGGTAIRVRPVSRA